MEVRRMLRQSLATHETASVLQMLKEHNPTSTSIRFNLQMIGDALLLALRQDASASSELAIACIDGLCERSWRGDYELNLQLRIGIGIDPAPLLRPLSVDLDELADVMEGDPLHAGGVVNLETGEVLLSSVVEYSVESGEYEADQFEDDCWMSIDNMGSRSGFDDMIDFIDVVEDRSLARRLDHALSGRHPFRGFKDALWDRSELSLWHDFSGDRQRGRARKWLAGCGYFPSVRV